jgi:hypothetical protein
MFGPHWDDNFQYQNTMAGLNNLDGSFKSKNGRVDPFL